MLSNARRIFQEGFSGQNAFALQCVAVAVFAAVTMATIPYVQGEGHIDPWIYTGLIYNYDDIVERYGATYYAARIAFIFPAIFFEYLFGDIVGFLVFHYLLLTIGALCLFILGQRIYSPVVGLAMAAVFCFTPWIQISTAYDSYEQAALTYLLIATVLALWPGSDVRIFHIVSGFFLAVATNVNLTMLAIFAFLGVSWLIAHRSRGLFMITQLICCGGLGLAAGSGLMAMFKLMTNDVWRNGDPTWAIGFNLARGGGETWWGSIQSYLSVEIYEFLIPLCLGLTLLACQLVVAWRRTAQGVGGSASETSDRLAADVRAGAAFIALGPLTFFLINQFLLKGGALGVFFYHVYLLPGSAIALGGLLYLTTAHSRRTAAVVAGALVIALLVMQIVLTPGALSLLDRPDTRAILLTCTAVAALTLGLYAAKKRAAAAIIVSLSGIFHFFLPYQEDPYAYLRQPHPGWDLRRGAHHLIDLTARNFPNGSGLRAGYWYNHESLKLYSLQSAQLWGYSGIGPSDPPIIDDATYTTMQGFGGVVVLTESGVEMQNALSALMATYDERNIHRRAEIVEEGRFDGERWDYHYAVVMFSAAAAPAPAPAADTSVAAAAAMPIQTIGILDLATITSAYWPPAHTELMSDGRVRIDSYPEAGGFSAIINIPENMRSPAPGVVRIWMETTVGRFTAAIARPDDASDWASNAMFPTELGETLVELTVDDLSAPVAVVFANAANGQSVGYVRAIEVARKPFSQ